MQRPSSSIPTKNPFCGVNRSKGGTNLLKLPSGLFVKRLTGENTFWPGEEGLMSGKVLLWGAGEYPNSVRRNRNEQIKILIRTTNKGNYARIGQQ